MSDRELAPLPLSARYYRDGRARRLLEKWVAALAIASLIFICLLLAAQFDWISAATPSRPSDAGIYYPDCAAARAAGAAPIHIGEPGYRPELDADSDGTACEPLHRPG
jgi:Excalibur calcium-binding domain